MTSKVAPPRRPTRIDDLDDSTLCRVFTAVAAESRRTLPVVCRRWQALCDANPSVWDHVHLDFCTRRLEGCERSLMYKWLLKRREGVQRLTCVTETKEDCFSVHLVMGLLGVTLRHVAVQARAARLDMFSVQWLSVLHQLKTLHLDLPGPGTLNHAPSLPPELEELTLRPIDRYGLPSLPPIVATARRLRRLAISGLDLRSFFFKAGSGALASLSMLEWLELRRGKMLELPSELTGLTRLTGLGLAGSAVLNPEHGWDPLRALSALRHLDLTACRLEEVPATAGQLPALDTLLLGHNRLTQLQDAPCLPQLDLLDLSGNRFEELPAALLSCTALAELRVQGNLAPREGAPMLLTDRALRKLLHNNRNLRRLSVTAGSLGSSRLANLRTSFPKVCIVEEASQQESPLPSSDSSSSSSSDNSSSDNSSSSSISSSGGSSSSDSDSSSDSGGGGGRGAAVVGPLGGVYRFNNPRIAQLLLGAGQLGSRSPSRSSSSSDEEDGSPRGAANPQGPSPREGTPPRRRRWRRRRRRR